MAFKMKYNKKSAFPFKDSPMKDARPSWESNPDTPDGQPPIYNWDNVAHNKAHESDRRKEMAKKTKMESPAKHTMEPREGRELSDYGNRHNKRHAEGYYADDKHTRGKKEKVSPMKQKPYREIPDFETKEEEHEYWKEQKKRENALRVIEGEHNIDTVEFPEVLEHYLKTGEVIVPNRENALNLMGDTPE